MRKRANQTDAWRCANSLERFARKCCKPLPRPPWRPLGKTLESIAKFALAAPAALAWRSPSRRSSRRRCADFFRGLPQSRFPPRKLPSTPPFARHYPIAANRARRPEPPAREISHARFEILAKCAKCPGFPLWKTGKLAALGRISTKVSRLPCGGTREVHGGPGGFFYHGLDQAQDCRFFFKEQAKPARIPAPPGSPPASGPLGRW